MRDALWERICLHLKSGRATLVYSTDGEQRLAFRVHNTPWQPVDFDGLTFMRRPLPMPDPGPSIRPGFSNAAQRLVAQRMQAKRIRAHTYVVIDLETTGLDPTVDAILEYGAVKVENGVPAQTFSILVRQTAPLPAAIAALTGIDDATLAHEGRPPEQALRDFLAFIDKQPIIGYNSSFDFAFIRTACSRFHLQFPTNPCRDLLPLARRKCLTLPNHKLTTLAQHFSLPPPPHRALPDALLIHQLNLKLNE